MAGWICSVYELSNSSHKYPTKELTGLALMLQYKVVKTKHTNSLAWPDPISAQGSYRFQGRSKVFTTGQARVDPEHYVIKCVGG